MTNDERLLLKRLADVAQEYCEVMLDEGDKRWVGEKVTAVQGDIKLARGIAHGAEYDYPCKDRLCGLCRDD